MTDIQEVAELKGSNRRLQFGATCRLLRCANAVL